MSWRRTLVLLPALLLIAAVVAMFAGWRWLMHTESGARWAFERGVSATGQALSATAVRGDLASGITVDRPAYRIDSVQVESDRIGVAVEILWSPFTVVVKSLDVASLDVKLGPPGGDDSESATLRGVLNALALPLRLRFEEAGISGIRVLDANDTVLVSFDAMEVDGYWDDHIEIDRLLVSAPVGNVAAEASLALTGSEEIAAHARLTPANDAQGLFPPVELDVEGDPDLLAVRASTQTATLDGRFYNLTEGTRWEARIEASTLSWPLMAESPAYAAHDIDLSATGDFGRYEATISADFEVPGLDKLPAEASGQGDFSSVTLERVNLHDGQATGSASLSWQGELNAAANLEINEMRLADWLTDWSGAQVLDGTLVAAWSPQQLRLDQSRLVVDTGDRQLTLAGTAGLSGDPADWRLGADVEVGTAQYPTGRLVLAGRGDRQQVTLDEFEGALLGGTISGSAGFDWLDDQPWSASVRLTSIDTSSLPFDWPAVLNGQVEAEGTVRPFSAIATLSGINGQFRSKDLYADGTLGYAGQDITACDLEIRHGESRLTLDGALHGADGFAFDVEVEDLGDYVTNAAGALEADGRASLFAQEPFLELNGQSDEIVFGDWRVGGVVIRDVSDGEPGFNVALTADQFIAGDRLIEKVGVVVAADSARQSVDLAGTLSDIALIASLSGAVDDIRKPTRWTGQLERFEVSDGEVSAELSGPAALSIGGQEFELTGFCIDGDLKLHLCGELRWQAAQGIDTSADVRSLPVEFVNVLRPTGLTFDQFITGSASWRQRADGSIDGEGRLDVSAGTIRSAARQEDSLATGAGQLSFDIRDGRLLAGDVRLPLPGIGSVDGRVEVDDVGDGIASGVGGGLDVVLTDLAPLEDILPWVDRLAGSFSAHLELGGSIDAPQVAGEARLRNAALTYRPVGLKLDDISLDSQLGSDGNVLVTGEFRAGDGTARILTRSDAGGTGAGGIEIQLEGENLTLIDVPDLKVVANPDVGLGFDGSNLQIDGRILIPSARVRPQNIGVSRVSESDDVVVVAGSLPTTVEQPQSASTDLQINGTLEVALGQDVALLLDVARTGLTGSTTFEWSGEPIPNANGRYDVDGEILVFGQRLEIAEGGVRFPNVRADDPLVRIRAVREIYGNSEVKEAGVLVTGSLRRPNVETFTVPMTTEERALTLLITGSDFDYEQGIGAVDFGTYIAPKLYASYGIGLFDQENVVRLRYDIARGFGITATSGQRDSGFDLSYRFEN